MQDHARVRCGEPQASPPFGLIALSDPASGPGPSGKAAAVFIVGAQDLASAGLKAILSRNGFNVTGTGRRLHNLDLPRHREAQNVLIIFDVAGAIDPTLEDIALLRRTMSGSFIVVLFDGSQDIVGGLPEQLGVNALLDRNLPSETLIKILNVVLSGYGVLSPAIRGSLDAAWSVAETEPRAPDAQAGSAASLSERELEIISCIAEGQSNKLIARRFSISEATVKIHVRGILRKVNARNRTQAALWALQRGFGSSVLALD